MGGEKVSWIEKEAVVMTDTFDVYLEKEMHFGPFKVEEFNESKDGDVSIGGHG